MCTTDQTCDCWDNGYAHCLGQLKTWASGTHGRNCDCDGCVVAVIILKNALHASGPSWTSSRRPHRSPRSRATSSTPAEPRTSNPSPGPQSRGLPRETVIQV